MCIRDRLVIACNPYCGPCAKAHQAIEELYEKYPGKIAVAVRFALHSNDENDAKVIASREIIKAGKTKPYEAIKDWYHLFDVGKFKQLHPTNSAEADNREIEKHISWSKEADIKGTPTFFINGRLLPELFSWEELSGVLDYGLKQ